MADLVTHNTDQLITRIQRQTAKMAPGSPHLKEAFTRIALYVSSVAKINVRRQKLIDTGRLINSIRWEFFKEGTVEGVQIGSFNVPYAAVHEFGFDGTVQVPTHQRRITKAFGRPIEPRSISIPAHSRRMKIRARPYMKPTIRTTSTFIIDTMRAALQFAKR